MSKLIDSIKRDTSPMLSKLDELLVDVYEKIKEWVKNAYNWLHNFFKITYDKICSWIDVLSSWIEEKLGIDDSFILTDPFSKIGSKIRDILNSSEINNSENGLSLSDFKNGVVGLHTKSEQLKDITTFSAEVVENPDKFNTMLQENDGVIVIKN